MKKPRVVVLTGAGISAESGFTTFRSDDGLWEKHRVEDVATPQGYARDPKLVQTFYNGLCAKLHDANTLPNAAHLALAQLEDTLGDRLLVVTQNVDNLHERAGSRNLIHMHGELLKVRCDFSGQVYDWSADVQDADRCHCCSPARRLRPHIVWFGEMPLQMDEIYDAISKADYFISICTSGHVYPAAGFVQVARDAGVHTVELNLEPSLVQSQFDEKIYGQASQVVPQYVQQFLQKLQA